MRLSQIPAMKKTRLQKDSGRDGKIDSNADDVDNARDRWAGTVGRIDPQP